MNIAAMDMAIQTTQLRELRDLLLQGLIERDTPIRLALLAALAGEHLLLIGPPGTAKSELARRLRHAFHDAAYFERLLTRFSTPEELFGPLSITALEQDRYVRKTEHYLPEASIAFLDEIFKANSAILNALLTLLNEREFDNGTDRTKTPLISVVAASNELPDGEELHALYDRFLLRYQVAPVTETGFGPLLDLRGSGGYQAPGDKLKLRREDVVRIQSEADTVTLSDEVKALLMEFRTFLAEQRITVSDRRWRKIVKLLQVSALTNGRQDISVWDCWLLQHCVWAQPDQLPTVRDWYEQRLGTKGEIDLSRITRLVGAQEALLSQEQSAQTQLRDTNGNLLYILLGHPTTGDTPLSRSTSEALYVAPEGTNDDRLNHGKGYTRSELWSEFRQYFGHNNDKLQQYVADPTNRLTAGKTCAPALGPVSYSSHHIQGRCARADGLLQDIRSHMSGIDRHITSLVATVDGHLWIQPGFSGTAKRSLEEALADAKQLANRMQNVLAGYSNLPVMHEAATE